MLLKIFYSYHYSRFLKLTKSIVYKLKESINLFIRALILFNWLFSYLSISISCCNFKCVLLKYRRHYLNSFASLKYCTFN